MNIIINKTNINNQNIYLFIKDIIQLLIFIFNGIIKINNSILILFLIFYFYNM